MNKTLKRIILDDIDAFNYLDPSCFKPRDKSKKDKENEEKLRPECKNDSEKDRDDKEEASDDELKPVFKSARNAVDLRRYLQYSNAKNE